MRFIGIDPGKSGGIAWISETGRIIAAINRPATNQDLLDALQQTGRVIGSPVSDGESYAMLEFVRSSPQMGVASAFTFGRGLGEIEMALAATGIPFDTVTPQRWQQALGCRSGGDKNITKARAQARWPGTKITHMTADALLLAEYCRRLKLGLLQPSSAIRKPR